MLDAARAEIARLTAAASPLRVALPTAALAAGTLARRGTTATVTGPAGARVAVTLAVTARRARKLGLASPLLGRADATIGSDGSVAVPLALKPSARRALRRLGRTVAVTVTGRSGDRIATSGATVTARAVTALAAGAALAHTEVKSTSPSAGASAKRPLRTVTVTFTQPIQRGTLRVKGPGKVVVSDGGGGRDPRNVARLKVRLQRGLGAGRYKAAWTIKAVDGHRQSGSFRFRLA